MDKNILLLNNHEWAQFIITIFGTCFLYSLLKCGSGQYKLMIIKKLFCGTIPYLSITNNIAFIVNLINFYGLDSLPS